MIPQDEIDSGVNSKLTILVTSCDAYSDLLDPFSKLWTRFWPDCPYEIVLVTEMLPQNAENLAFTRIVCCGKGHSWTERLVIAIDTISSPYILMLCDDYFLCGPINSARIAHFVELIQKYDSINLKLIKNGSNVAPFSADPELGEYKKNSAYCIATQPSIWDKKFLSNLARNRARGSIWEFERYGSFSCADATGPILGTAQQEFPFIDAVHKGNWGIHVAELCERYGLVLDLAIRGFPSPLRKAIEWGKSVILNMNPDLVVMIQNKFNLGKK